MSNPYFSQTAFDAETTQAMDVAYEKLCSEMGLPQRGDPLNNLVASIIVQVARTGERNPDKLRTGATELLIGTAV